MGFDYGTAEHIKQGQSVNGDTYVVEHIDADTLLVAVIDGLGGGTEAAHASQTAADVVRSHLTYELTDIMQQVHSALHHTRGAVMALLRLSERNHQATYVGVGNIGVQVYSSESIKPISKNGIMGYRLPSLLRLEYTYQPGDTFVLYSDGISSRFSLDHQAHTLPDPEVFAAQILQHYGKQSDDATIVVVRTS